MTGRTMADVSVLVPAWQAAAFIDRTLEAIRAQTHADLRILVSVDAGADDTAGRCRAHAALDPRVEVIEQPTRLGWWTNINALLDRVDTPFAGLVFHDDLVEPTYVERLRAALLADPGAASAHSDLRCFGDRDGVEPGRDHLGDAADRVLDFLRSDATGAPLRSLVRGGLFADGLRLSSHPDPGQWRCLPFSLRLLAAGRAHRIAAPLYARCFRAGSLTATAPPRDAIGAAAVQGACRDACLEVIGSIPASAAQRDAMQAALPGA
jgi:glycosyltransferase involved in cell wall biosynthesis